MKFDEWRAIHQSFPFQFFPCNTFPMKATINSLPNFLTCLICQISLDFSTVKVLCYTVLIVIAPYAYGTKTHTLCIWLYHIGIRIWYVPYAYGKNTRMA